MKKDWLLGHLRRSQKNAEVVQKRAITGTWLVLSIMELRYHLGWGITSKPKAQNLKQHF